MREALAVERSPRVNSWNRTRAVKHEKGVRQGRNGGGEGGGIPGKIKARCMMTFAPIHVKVNMLYTLAVDVLW